MKPKAVVAAAMLIVMAAMAVEAESASRLSNGVGTGEPTATPTHRIHAPLTLNAAGKLVLASWGALKDAYRK